MRKESLFSLFAVLIGLALQGAAWIWAEASQGTRVLLTLLSLLPIVVAMLVQGVESQGIRAWLSSLAASLRINSPLVIMIVLSLGVLVVLPYINVGTFSINLLSDIALSIATILFTISVFTFIRGLGSRPSLRVVKGSSDRIDLVKDGVRHLIPEPLTLLFVLLDSYREVECISDTELSLYREGEPLPSISSCDLVKGSGPTHYVIWQGERKPIPDNATLQQFFPDRTPQEMNDIDLEAIPRTGTLRSIRSFRPTIVVQGDVENISIGH